jgi:hypothetical protein
MNLHARTGALEFQMRRFHPIDFLIDVDNTLLDNDGIQQDLKRRARMCSALKRHAAAN